MTAAGEAGCLRDGPAFRWGAGPHWVSVRSERAALPGPRGFLPAGPARSADVAPVAMAARRSRPPPLYRCSHWPRFGGLRVTPAPIGGVTRRAGQ